MTIKSILSKASNHPGEAHLIYVLLSIGVIFLFGFYFGKKSCHSENQHIIDQLNGKLTEKEKLIQAADLQNGKITSELKDEKDAKSELEKDNLGLSKTAAALASKYNLSIEQVKRLQAYANFVAKNGTAGTSATPEFVTSTKTECSACKGEINYGTYATCSWADYASLKTGNPGPSSLSLRLGVKVNSVTLQQKKKNGALQAVIDKVYLTDDKGNVLTEARLDESSRSISVPDITGDPFRRKFFLYGGINANSARLGLFTQKKLFFYGLGVDRNFKDNRISPEVIFGIQVF